MQYETITSPRTIGMTDQKLEAVTMSDISASHGRRRHSRASAFATFSQPDRRNERAILSEQKVVHLRSPHEIKLTYATIYRIFSPNPTIYRLKRTLGSFIVSIITWTVLTIVG